MTHDKIIQVVMLATQNSNLYLIDDLLSYEKEGKSFKTNWDGADIKPQHLYFLSNEEIKMGDLILHKLDREPQIYKRGIYINEDPYSYGYKKVISTTNKFLYTLDEPDFPDLSFHTSLPEPSDSFIQKYVEEYNKGYVIKEVLVEWEYEPSRAYGITGDFITREINRLKVAPDNIIIIKKIEETWEDVIEYYLSCNDTDKIYNRQHLINFLKAEFNPPTKK